MVRRLLTPRLLLAHVVVLVAVVVMVNLGFWQLRRLDQARSFNDQLEQRVAAPVLTEADLDELRADELGFRRLTVTGEYVLDEELLHLARGYRGQSGNHVLTPLVTEGGRTVLVDRGWVPATEDTPPVAAAAPPAGPVTVTGQLLESQEYASFGSRDATEGDLDRVLRVNLPRIEEQLADGLPALVPAYLQVREQEPPQRAELPLAAEQPTLDDGPHLGYAVQWFLFAATALVVYAAFLRKRLAEPAGDATPEEAVSASA